MSLSLTTRRRLQTSSTKWTSQQHLLHQQEPPATQPVRKQRSFIEPSAKLSAYTASSSRLQRGLSVGRSHQDIQRGYNRQILRHHPSLSNRSNGRKDDGGEKLLRDDNLIKKNITTCGKIERPSRNIQAWSSTSSILKSLDKELAQLNGVLGKTKDLRNNSDVVDNATNLVTKSTNKTKNESGPLAPAATNPLIPKVNKFPSKTEANKVNLSIVLSHALSGGKENDSMLSDQGDGEESDDSSSTDCEKLRNCNSKTKDTTEAVSGSKLVAAHQRRILYHATKHSVLSSVGASSNGSCCPSNNASGPTNPNNLNTSPSLTIQKRPPLVRAMSAPVRSFDENSKGPFLANKRKSRRRKLNARTITCDKDPDESLINVNDFSSDTTKKILQRSRSVAPDVITLVSLISSEGSDSEKEDCSTTPSNSDSNSPTRRAPTLRKTGKSVSFQENYPPTFQFASKEYSHMLRRGSIAPLAARIKSNRPPTAPPVSIFHTANNHTSKTTMDLQENHEYDLHGNDNNNENSSPKPTTMLPVKKLESEESYQYPDYVRSLKERECWKLYQKMSTKGVNITYDTILRGMLTPTEFRQLQKQREFEEAKALKENEELAALNGEQQKSKNRQTPIEKLREESLIGD